MNLGLCIANLLRRYPAVEVPGIGVFKITRTPASYDEERSVLFPPTSHIELTNGATDFFPILTYLQVQKGVDEATAVRILEKAVKKLVDAVARDGRALLDGIGYLIADGASFGFRPFDVDTAPFSPVNVPREKEKVVVPVTTDKKELAEGIEEPMEATEPVEEEVAESPAKNPVVRWITVAAVVLLLLAAGATWYYKSGWFERETKAELSLQKEEVEDLAGQGDAAYQAASPVDTAVASTPTDQLKGNVADSMRADTSAVAVSKPVKPAVTYEIIVGSFATMAQARKYVAEMKAKGYELRALDSRMPGNRKKISWGSYATEEEAYRELVRVQKNFEPGAWIAKVEND